MCLGKVVSNFQMQSLCINSMVGESSGLNGEGPASVLRLRAQTVCPFPSYATLGILSV